MKIWFVNQYAIPPSQAGITRHYDFARGLIEQGHEVTVIASSFDHVTRKETRLSAGEKYRLEDSRGVPFLWLRTPPYEGNGIARVLNMLSFAWLLLTGQGIRGLQKPDVIVGSSPHLFGAMAAYLLSRRLGSKFVLEVRDLWPESLIELGNFSRHHPVVKVLESIEKILYSQASVIVSLLPYAVEHMISKGAKPDKVVWIPNGVSLERVPKSETLPNATLFKALYAGTHGLANSLDTLIDAAQELQMQGHYHIEVQFLGDGPEKARLQARVSEMGLRNVTFEPTIQKSEVYQRLLQADAFILPLMDSPLFKWGISANKLFDYLACRRPVVFAVNSPNNPVEECNAGITVPPGNHRALAEALLQISRLSQPERLSMGQRGYKYVSENYELRTLVRRYEQVFMSLRKT